MRPNQHRKHPRRAHPPEPLSRRRDDREVLAASVADAIDDDSLLDATQIVAITATAAGYLGGGDSLDVTDHETLTLSIVAASVAENAGAARIWATT